MRIPLKDIYLGDRIRQDYGTAEMEQLEASLRDNGQIQPIAVRPAADYDRREEEYSGEPWVLVSGGRRCAAAFSLGWKDIEAYAREEMAELTSKILELHENLMRKPMSQWEELEAKKQIVALRKMENPKITEGEIAKELGISHASLSTDLKTQKLIEKYPALKQASGKRAALTAGQILEDNALRERRAAMNLSQLTAGVAALEERIVTADALEYVGKLPTASIDLALLDGPYGYRYWQGGQKLTSNETALSSYDDDPQRAAELYKALVPDLVRAVRETGWLVFFAGKETYDLLEDLLENLCATHFSYRHLTVRGQCEAQAGQLVKGDSCRFLRPNPYPWIWHRPNSRNRPRHPTLHAQNVAELILVCNRGKARLSRPCTSLLTYDSEYGSERVHANQKPFPLYRELVERFTLAGDTVLDCFFGSGQSLAAAASLARIPYGCDSNPEMLPFAIGSIKKNSVIVSESLIRVAHERYQKALLAPQQEFDYEEGDPVPVAEGPPALSRKAGCDWQFEVLRLEGEYLGYITYDGHNMGQRRGHDLDALEMELSTCCQTLSRLSTLGIIDPCECTPEEAMQALREFEEAS